MEGESRDLGASYLINIAELFEIYISKLLQKEFKDWSVASPKINLCSGKFYERKIMPDIVMSSGDDVLVFDVKYKRMRMQGKTKHGAGDLDRNDFFQINTYMSYYQNAGKNVLAGGLLYPMDAFDESRCHSQSWLGNAKTKFIVDGIELAGSLEEIKTKESEFIARIRAHMR